MTDDTQRTLGEHGAHIEALQADMRELKTDIKSILGTLSEAKGGWKTLLLLGGVSGTIGALAAKAATFFTAMPLPR